MNIAMRTVLVVAIIAILVGAVILVYVYAGKARQTLVFSPTQVLGATWIQYKNEYVLPGNSRTVDPSRAEITTSEGESYTMLRGVWMDDKSTFDASWTWTQKSLQHTSDHLFSWVYGKLPNGSYGVLTNMNGTTSASDGDIKGTPYLTADNLESTSLTPYAVIDPSYLAPEDYRIFALVDPGDPWNSLVSSSYSVLQESIQQPLDKSKSADLPPDWISINKTTGVIGPPPVGSTTTGAATSTGETTNFGFDALRVPFRLALDYTWFHDSRDTSLLSEMNFLKYTWESAHAIGETYSHDGTPVEPAQTPAMYGGTLGYFLYEDSSDAKAIYQTELVSMFNPNSNQWQTQLSYYDDNWAWFGVALFNGLLPNLAASATFPATP